MDAVLAGTVGTAVKLTVANLHAVPDDHAPAVSAPGRQSMDRAFETVEHMPFIAHHYFERLVIVISTDFTLGHRTSFLLNQPIR
jgi:hypothetical protein